VEQTTVKEFMVPLSEYATVSQNASMVEAVITLEEAQRKYDRTQYTHRAILVRDDQGHIVGKLSQMDVLRGLEPKYNNVAELKGISHSGFSVEFIRSIMETQSLWADPLAQICRKASMVKVKEIMYTPKEGDYVREGASLTEAIHQLIMGRHQSLLVTRDKEVVGILRLSDAFVEVCKMIKACPVT